MSEEEVCNIDTKSTAPKCPLFYVPVKLLQRPVWWRLEWEMILILREEERFSLCQSNDTTLERKGRLVSPPICAWVITALPLALWGHVNGIWHLSAWSLDFVILTGVRHIADQSTRLGWIEPATLKLMGFDLSDFRIYFNLINLSLNWVHFSEKFLRAQLISSGSNLSADSNLMRDFFWVVNCYICLFKITNSKSKEKPLANCINALQRKHILPRSITGTVCIILKKNKINVW